MLCIGLLNTRFDTVGAALLDAYEQTADAA